MIELFLVNGESDKKAARLFTGEKKVAFYVPTVWRTRVNSSLTRVN